MPRIIALFFPRRRLASNWRSQQLILEELLYLSPKQGQRLTVRKDGLLVPKYKNSLYSILMYKILLYFGSYLQQFSANLLCP